MTTTNILVRSKTNEVFSIIGSAREGLTIRNHDTKQSLELDHEVMEALAEALHECGVEYEDPFPDEE